MAAASAHVALMLSRRMTGSLFRLTAGTRCHESKAGSRRLEQTGESIEQRSVVAGPRRRCAPIENRSDEARAIDSQCACARCVDATAVDLLVKKHAVTDFDGLRIIFANEHQIESHRVFERPVGHQANSQHIENVCHGQVSKGLARGIERSRARATPAQLLRSTQIHISPATALCLITELL